MSNLNSEEAINYIKLVQAFGPKGIWAALSMVVKHRKGAALEAHTCEQALAAIELIAASKGEASPNLAQVDLDWAMAYDLTKIKLGFFSRSVKTVPLALSALERITKNSELKSLRIESGELETWLGEQSNLKMRLLGGAAS